MREFNGLVKYQMQQYFSTSKFVMPFAVLMILLYSIYSSKPVGVMDSLTVSCVFLFLVMVWVGVTACDMEDMVSEQILILRVQSAGKYYVSHAVFLFLLGMMISAVAVIFPVLMDLWNQGQLFERPFGAADLAGGFTLMCLSGFSGASPGRDLTSQAEQGQKDRHYLHLSAGSHGCDKDGSFKRSTCAGCDFMGTSPCIRCDGNICG